MLAEGSGVSRRNQDGTIGSIRGRSNFGRSIGLSATIVPSDVREQPAIPDARQPTTTIVPKTRIDTPLFPAGAATIWKP
jgi:hypothetical protein